jgi:phage baseplate assembly protein gpV
MPAAIFNGANVKILKDILKGKSGWRIVGTGLTYDYTLPAVGASGSTIVVENASTGAKYIAFAQDQTIPSVSTDTDILYFKDGADPSIGQYDRLFFKDDDDEEHEIDPSLGKSSIIRTNAQTISENITIPSTTNGMTAGPVTIASTYTVTVSGNWSVV